MLPALPYQALGTGAFCSNMLRWFEHLAKSSEGMDSDCPGGIRPLPCITCASLDTAPRPPMEVSPPLSFLPPNESLRFLLPKSKLPASFCHDSLSKIKTHARICLQDRLFSNICARNPGTQARGTSRPRKEFGSTWNVEFSWERCSCPGRSHSCQ